MAAITTRWESQLASLLLSVSSTTPSSSSRCYQIEEEVKQICRRMMRVEAFLNDTENWEIRDGSTMLWLRELKDVACNAEDVVEELEYELVRYQLVCEDEEQDQATHEERGATRESQISDSFIRSPCPALHDALFQQQIISKIKKINNQLDEIFRDNCALKVNMEDGQRNKKQNVMERPPSSSVSGNSHVYGRNVDKDAVVDMLLSSQSHEHGADNVSVVSIVGMGGIGKTTLAQLVYKDDRVKKHFEPRMWVCVSDCFDVVRLTREIVEAVTSKRIDLQGFSPLQEKLRELLEGKRFLVVLDDLWNESPEQWDALWGPLNTGAEGSKVLVTTRNEKVSRISGAIRSKTHYLKVLSEHDCWSLFAQCSFRCQKLDDHPKLVTIGKEIVQKCGGLPLAIKTLGGLVFNETDEDWWNDILRSEIWELPEEENCILPPLKLSYQHLPSPIKPCFAFCAVFPKDSCFSRVDLIRFWMAQGYIKPTAGKCMEDVGQEYFDALSQRSLFESWGIEFKMHDLVHDLALSVCEGEFSKVEDGKLSNTLRRVRHLSFKCEADMRALLSCGSTDGFQYLRTYCCHNDYGGIALSVKLLDNMFPLMKHLRVLDLRQITIRELPDSVGNLKHLRYLGIFIQKEGISRLPESLCDLLNLQTIHCRGTYIRELPKRLKDLVNLRHLDLEHNCYSMMPRGIGRLTQLRTLRSFFVGKGNCAADIGELRHLNDLQGELEIDVKSLSNWVNREPNILNRKKGLKKLVLDLDVFRDTCDDESDLASMQQQQQQQQQQELLELIQPHPNIEELSISGYIGSKLPKWVGDPSYWRLRELHLTRCVNCRHLTALGQLPALKSLYINDMHDLKSVGCELLGDGRVVNGASPFPSLEQLSLSVLSKLEELLLIGTEDGGAFPRLSKLVIYYCRKLQYVKLRHLFALEVLHIIDCGELTTLDSYHGSISQSRSSGFQQEDVHHMYPPRIRTLWLQCCLKLRFLPPAQQQLPSSLRWLDVSWSPQETGWVRRHADKLLGLTVLSTDEYLRLRNVESCDDDNVTALNGFFRKLELRWNLEQPRFPCRPEEAERILQYVGPRVRDKLLEEVVIEGYHGRNFPDWVRYPYFLRYVVKMTLSGCIHCERLPPLGQLPSLRRLYISNMHQVEHVSREFCGEERRRDGVGAFPNLRFLSISNCPKLRTFQLLELPVPDSGGGGIPPCFPGMLSSGPSSSSSISLSLNPFPRLKVLFIEDCPELVSLVGVHGVCSLEIFILQHCPRLDFSHEVQLRPEIKFANIRACPLLSGWRQGNRIPRLGELWIGEELAFSDGTDPNGESVVFKIDDFSDSDGTTKGF